MMRFGNFVNSIKTYVINHIKDTTEIWTDEITHHSMSAFKKWSKRAVILSGVGCVSLIVAYNRDEEARQYIDMRRLKFYANRENKAYLEKKKKLFENLNGKILELKAGVGSNFAAFPSDILLDYEGIEYNKKCLDEVREQAVNNGIPSPLLKLEHTNKTLDYLKSQRNGTYDSIICTHALASYNEELDILLSQIMRVLRPGGCLIFIEHTAHTNTSSWYNWQKRLNGIWKYIGDDCKLDRDILKVIEKAGFDKIDHEIWRGENKGAQRIQAGIAIKPGQPRRKTYSSWSYM